MRFKKNNDIYNFENYIYLKFLKYFKIILIFIYNLKNLI